MAWDAFTLIAFIYIPNQPTQVKVLQKDLIEKECDFFQNNALVKSPKGTLSEDGETKTTEDGHRYTWRCVRQ